MKRHSIIISYICNIYVTLWLLYNFHWQGVGDFFPILDFFSNLFLGMNLIISAVFAGLAWKNYMNSPVMQSILVLVLLFTIYGLISIMQDGKILIRGEGAYVSSGTYLIGALRSFLPLCTFYYLTKNGYLTENFMRYWFWVFLIQSVYLYFMGRMMLGLSGMDEVRTNNLGYIFVALFPFVCLFDKKPFLQSVIIFLFLFITIMSLKRGAILTMTLAILFFFWNQAKSLNSIKKIIAIAFFCISLFFLSDFVGDMYERNDVFQRRIENTLEGRTSGRDEITSHLLSKYANSNLIYLIFGYGADGTIKELRYAHNDWLEMLYDQGVIGFFAYFVFWFVIYRIMRNQFQRKTSIALFLGVIFICNFTKTFFSMWFSMANMYITMPLGYCLAIAETKVRNNLKLKRCV